MTKELHLNLFLMPRGHHESAWRHPRAAGESLTDLALYTKAARIAEAAKMDAVFLADALVAPASGGLVASGVLEPIALLSALAAVTDRIGLIGTASTTYSLPYTLARQFATLDHLSNGRAGWNIVTSWAPQAGLNYGHDTDPSHAERYRMAQDFMQAVDALWRSWPAEALLDDRARGIYSRSDLIRPVDHRGPFFRTLGPLNVPASPQSRPVYVQAGQSEDGRAFAAEWAEVIFTAHMAKDTAQAFYADVKGRAAARGRRPADIAILPGLSAAIGSTQAEADRVFEELDDLTGPEIGLTRLSARFGGHDFSQVPLDRPLRPGDFPDPSSVEASKSRAMGYAATALKEGLTLRQLLQRLAGARGHLTVAGTPDRVADLIEDWFRSGAADGFNVMPPVIYEQLELFASEVIPLLQKRGIFRREYRGRTLREHFGLAPAGQEPSLAASA
ncbi:LLM class flavin-dependent oxidoreductase [Paracoccus benzoatiresistens]|uniref:LLM class flavin-dependent oxidoreductase n=1 Tax=Paracoccus benzoatiresistens TaxID=2997341 RepID=A0ABT4J620_9RHOB|nr:LLM class flavin-dependent oxidoreductase [Paracoccus sp. EF6]MCZ0962506.1 LLM class flavin-dependent oxidoreductase [Paracoccus sp. EF6]